MTHSSPPDTDKLPYESEHLDALSRMRTLDSYYRWVFGLLMPYMGSRILDAGCGIGNFTSFIVGSADYVVAADLSPANVDLLQTRFRSVPNVEVVRLDLESDFRMDLSEKVDTVVCLDVLEHVEDDIGLLTRFQEIVGVNGKLLLKVPAGPWLFGSIDEASGHYRRYSRHQLVQVVQNAGWEVVMCRHMNLFGTLPYWVKSRLLKTRSNFSRTFSDWQLCAIRRAIPIIAQIDRLVGPPFGQSLVLAAQHNGTD